ncbi:TetR/AcrR family transcriptional regulator [Bosea sp. (in: a-proteobacteria)]|uniref:TetR/AcrR family transcriptional regulator n=1 Tax=Bosea sp. (in: a-proteobacteria) TaxID=1871050 RepID=UPI002B474D78|nr:TetR/AcrR family transcriptional regulator [Bosea sp. (in: a-proteobacteria)]WRH56747.1 MAG: TetR/AcrR family transcriptional regulator [Bosea sp. (in: a-proteobacteria)]
MVAAKATEPDRAGDLAPDAWVTGGLEILSEEGIDAVRVERIAKRIGVSKGPFYWRYPDRPALLKAMLTHWRAERTRGLIDQVAAETSARKRLDTLVRLALRDRYGSIDVARLEGAVRAWAAQDDVAAAVIREVDSERIQHLEGELALLGAGPTERSKLAQAIYIGLIGLYTVRRYTPEFAADPAYLAIVELVLSAAEGRRDGHQS